MFSSLKSAFFGSAEEKPELNQHLDPEEKTETRDDVAEFIDPELLEEMYCFTMSDSSMYTLKPAPAHFINKKRKQQKIAEIMSASFNIAQQRIDD